MTRALDESHDPRLRSWVESAHAPGTDFPIQNLPLGIFRRGGGGPMQAGVAIGDKILDVSGCRGEGLFSGAATAPAAACAHATLNAYFALDPMYHSSLRRRLVELLRVEAQDDERRRVAPHLVPLSEAEMQLPAAIGDYSDFYASIHHATNVGRLFRPDNPLLPNYKHLPIAYHGRASSVVVSGTHVPRPLGQSRGDASAPPAYGPTRSLDYEAEIGLWVGRGNTLGEPVPIGEAESRIAGVSLLNDWSARDVQSWEYQPLGPFLAKSFATSVSPWVVSLQALTPFRTPAFPRPEGDPPPLPYLDSPTNREEGGFGIAIEVWLRSTRMKQEGHAAVRLSRGEVRDLYWTPAQMVAHHTSNGCNLRTGDLLGSGTISGAAVESRGCLLERTARGSEPLRLPTGEERRFLEDGDEVVLKAFAERDGFVRIGFGECQGQVIPARPHHQ